MSQVTRVVSPLVARPEIDLQISVSGKHGSTDRQITDYTAKVGWNSTRYKLHSTVVSLIFQRLEALDQSLQTLVHFNPRFHELLYKLLIL